MRCLVYLRILTLTSLCQPSLHLDRFENDRESLWRENSYMKSPRKIRSDLSQLKRENVEDEFSNKRSFWSRPVAKTQKRRSFYSPKLRHNEPRSLERRTAPYHRSIESDEYRTREKGTDQNINAEHTAQKELEIRCGRNRRQQTRFPSDKEIRKFRLNDQEEYLSDEGNEGFGRRKRRFRDGGHRRNIESETFLSGEETIQDRQKMLLDSFRRRKRTGENVGKLRWRRKRKKEKAEEERKTARTNFAVYGNKGNAGLAKGGVNSFGINGVAVGRTRFDDEQKKIDGSRHDFARDYFRKRRKRRQIMDGDDFKRLRRQSEEGQVEGNRWATAEEGSDTDNVQEVSSYMNKGAGFETDDYGNEQESVGDETELADDVRREIGADEIQNSKGDTRHSELCARFSSVSQKNTGNKKMHSREWGRPKSERDSGINRESENNAKSAERRRWVYINNVYPYPNTRGQKINSEKVKPPPIGDLRRARRVHRKLPEVTEFLSDEDAVREEAEWDKEYAINDAEEADRDHRQAETMEAEAEVQEHEKKQEKLGGNEMKQALGPETEEELPGLRESERQHRRLEKGSKKEAEVASRHQRTNFETRVNRFIGNVESTNVASSPLLSGGTLKEDKIRWNVILMLAFGLLVFALR